MANNSLRSVRARMEMAIKDSGISLDDTEAYFEYAEMLAIQVLDSEFDDFSEGVLENYLRLWLEIVELESQI